MTQHAQPAPSVGALAVFSALRRRKNVLVTGPPGTGKTRLLNEVARLFVGEPPRVGFHPGGGVPFPSAGQAQWLPSHHRDSRRSFRVVFHPGTRYRHLLRGLEPVPNASNKFRYSRGILFEANEHARSQNGASLLVIDELNRGPAVEAFGEAVVALEADKRLDDDDHPTNLSYPVQLPGDDGQIEEYYFSAHLYVLAAMNEADASVAPLDVAFRRRWEQFPLKPDVAAARAGLGLTGEPGEPGSPEELLGALVDAWSKINERVSLLRGPEYQLGHALVIAEPGRQFESATAAAAFVEERWGQLEHHVSEVFFGDPRAEVAALAGASEGTYSIVEHSVGIEQGTSIRRPTRSMAPAAWTRLLKALASAG